MSVLCGIHFAFRFIVFLSLFFVSAILGEPIVPTTYIGLVLIVAGIVFNEYCVKAKAKN